MYGEFLHNALNPFGVTDRLMQPGRRVSALLIDNTEKLFNLHLQAARVYTDIGLSQLRAMVSVHDSESLQQYVANQANVAETVVQRATEDAETVAGIGNDFASEASRIASENVTSLRDAVSPAPATETTRPKTTTRRTGNKPTTGNRKRATTGNRRQSTSDSGQSA